MANSNFIVQNGLNVGGSTGANISVDPASGAMYIIPSATAASPNPTAMVFTTSGTIVSVSTVGGVANVANIGIAANASITSGLTTFSNVSLGNIFVNGSTGSTGQFLSSNGAGLTWVTLSSSSINSGSSNVTVTAGNIFANVSSTNIVGINALGVVITPQLTSNTVTSNTGTLSVGGNINYGPDYGLVASFVSNIPGYNYVAVQNLNTGGNSSSSFTAYNNTGTSYIDVGVNSSNFNAVSSGFVNNSLNTANASYAYAYGGDMVVGTWNNNSIHFITNAVTTAGDSMVISGNGNVYISGNLTVSGNTSFVYTTTNFLTESANVVSTAYLSGNASTNSSTITLNNNIVPNGNTTINLGSGTAYYGTTYTGQLTANTVTATSLGGTLTTASQPNITTLAGVTSIGASSSTTLTGTLQTASQTNITAVGTLSGLTVSGAIVPNGNLTVNLGSTSAWFNNIYGTSTHALYADLAENYIADKFYNPGTVLMFGGSEEVTVADANTTAVAGVVSTNPAHLMNGALSGSNIVPLALVGRVPCNVIGPVAKGDLMVSAGFGYAKSNNSAGVGQVIGKALADFPLNAKGVIEVVVGRV